MSSFNVFCRIACPTDPEMCPNLSLLDLTADAVSHLGVISSTLVFERPYNGFATFTHVSCARTMKKPSSKALETFLVAHCGKNMLGKLKDSTKNTRNHPT